MTQISRVVARANIRRLASYLVITAVIGIVTFLVPLPSLAQFGTRGINFKKILEAITHYSKSIESGARWELISDPSVAGYYRIERNKSSFVASLDTNKIGINNIIAHIHEYLAKQSKTESTQNGHLTIVSQTHYEDQVIQYHFKIKPYLSGNTALDLLKSGTISKDLFDKLNQIFPGIPLYRFKNGAEDFFRPFSSQLGLGIEKIRIDPQFNISSIAADWARVERGKRVYIVGHGSENNKIEIFRETLKANGMQTFFYLDCIKIRKIQCSPEELAAMRMNAGSVVVISNAAPSEYVKSEREAILASGGFIVAADSDSLKTSITSRSSIDLFMPNVFGPRVKIEYIGSDIIYMPQGWSSRL